MKMDRKDDMFGVLDGCLTPVLSVDDRQDRPFSCSLCGRTYEACIHWSIEDTLEE